MFYKKRNIYLTFATALFLFMLINTFSILRGNEYDVKKVFYIFTSNLPACILITWVDVKIVKWLTHKNIKTAYRFLIEFILSIAMVFIAFIIMGAINYFLQIYETFNPGKLSYLAPMILSNCMFLTIVEAFVGQERLSKMTSERAMFQFEALKNQINPHFLFNSLNVLSSLIYESPDLANAFTKKLAQVYRYLLDTQKQATVSAIDEMMFVDSYIYLERIRFKQNLVIEITNREHLSTQCVIPASVQMLIENAIKHNIATTANPLRINIVILDDCIRVNNNIQLRTSVSKSGIGLKNLQNQYAYYGKIVEIITHNGHFIVKLPYV